MTKKLDKLISVVEGMGIRLATIEEQLRNDRHLRFKIKASSSEFVFIVRVVAKVFEVSEASILAKRRMEKISVARQAAMILAKQFLVLNFCEVGRLFKRDHATVIWADRAVQDRRVVNSEFRRKYRLCERLIKEQLRTLNNHEHPNSESPSVPRSRPIPEGSGHTTLPPPVGQVDRSP